jgi:hypothetical protein
VLNGWLLYDPGIDGFWYSLLWYSVRCPVSMTTVYLAKYSACRQYFLPRKTAVQKRLYRPAQWRRLNCLNIAHHRSALIQHPLVQDQKNYQLAEERRFHYPGKKVPARKSTKMNYLNLKPFACHRLPKHPLDR